MKTLVLIVVSILTLAMVGCGNTASNAASKLNRQAKAAGSPIRWKSESRGGQMTVTRVLIDLPRGATKADALLKKEILSKIAQVESSKGRSVPELEEVRLMPDGREVWVLKNLEHGVAYVIGMEPSAQGGTDFTVVGPEHYSRR